MAAMRRALSLARRSLGGVSPNPAVGAVVLNGGEVVGEGRTEPPGGRHAEAAALEQAGGAARGGVMYVSLEPCNHHGRTPPCVDAILDAGIAEVHAAIADPNPRVAGGGADALRDAGVKVVVGERAAEASTLLEAYLKWVTTGRPFVTVKFAMSLDGKIATRSGHSQWITGERARQHVHELRAASDAVMVGIGTVLADDPLLTARDRRGRPLERQPIRVVVDGKGRTPPGARLFSQPGPVIVATAAESRPVAGAQTVSRALPTGIVDVDWVFRYLGAERDVTSVLVEGGPTLLGSLFDFDLVDKVVAFVAPTVVGGDEAPSAVGGLGAGTMSGALKLERPKVRRFGRDTAIIGYC